jgi:hypothetical protein
VIAKMLKDLGFKDLGYLMNPGIYVLCLNEEVVYVGQTRNMFHRFAGSDHTQRVYNKMYFIKCSFEELDRLESLMILKLKPTQNTTYNFNNNTDFRNRPTPAGPSESSHTISVMGTSLELKGWRRI